MMELVPPWRYSVHNYQIFKLPHLQSIILQHYKHFINYLKHIRKKDGLAKMHCEVSGQVVFGRKARGLDQSSPISIDYLKLKLIL
jgi:hypothetical protein